MGAVITADDLKPAVQSGGFNVKEIEGFVGVLERMFDKAMKLKQMKEGQQSNNTMTNNNIGTPQQVVNSPAPKEVVIHQKREIDEAKLKQFLEEVFVKMADKLPEDIKEMKIKDITGENFVNFKYSIRKLGVNFEIDKDAIIEELSKNILAVLPQLEKN